MITQTKKLELMKLLQMKKFNVLLTEQGKAKDVAELVKNFGNKPITVVVID